MNRKAVNVLLLFVIMLFGVSKEFCYLFNYYNNANGVNVVTHPKNYWGTGGAQIVLKVGINPNSSVTDVSALRASILNNIFVWNQRVLTTANIKQLSDANSYDFESVTLHEMGHALGLAHPNLASESGLTSPQDDSTAAYKGANGVYDVNPGPDGVYGSSDDIRGDDLNFFYFNPSNDPFTMAFPVDSTQYTNNIDYLPISDAFAANGGWQVSQLLLSKKRNIRNDDIANNEIRNHTKRFQENKEKKGVEIDHIVDLCTEVARPVNPSRHNHHHQRSVIGTTESVMQQGTYAGEYQRTLTADDIAAIEYAETGIDEIYGTSDDYSFLLTYAGETTTNIDIEVYVDPTYTGFAVTQSTAYALTNYHYSIAGTPKIRVNPSYSWFFNSFLATSLSPLLPPGISAEETQQLTLSFASGGPPAVLTSDFDYVSTIGGNISISKVTNTEYSITIGNFTLKSGVPCISYKAQVASDIVYDLYFDASDQVCFSVSYTPSPSPSPSVSPSVTRTPSSSTTPSISVSSTSSISVSQTPTPSTTSSQTSTRTPSSTISISSTPTISVSSTSSISTSPSITPTPTITVSATISISATVSPSVTPTPSISISSSISRSSSASPTSTPSPTSSTSRSSSSTASPSASPSSSISLSASPSSSISLSSSITPTISITPTTTATISVTGSNTPSQSFTSTITPTISITSSVSPTISITPSVSATISVTSSVTSTISITSTISVSPSPSVTASISITASTTASPSSSITATSSSSPSISISSTKSSSATISKSVTPSSSSSATPSISLSSSHSASISPSITSTSSISESPSMSSTSTHSISGSVSSSISASSSPSISVTSSPSSTNSVTSSISVSPSITPTISTSSSVSPTISFSVSITPTISITPSNTPSISVTPSITPTISVTPSITPTTSITPSTTPSISKSSTSSPTRSISSSMSASISNLPSSSMMPRPRSSSPSLSPALSITSSPFISQFSTQSPSNSPIPESSISSTPSSTHKVTSSPSLSPSSSAQRFAFLARISCILSANECCSVFSAEWAALSSYNDARLVTVFGCNPSKLRSTVVDVQFYQSGDSNHTALEIIAEYYVDAKCTTVSVNEACYPVANSLNTTYWDRVYVIEPNDLYAPSSTPAPSSDSSKLLFNFIFLLICFIFL